MLKKRLVSVVIVLSLFLATTNSPIFALDSKKEQDNLSSSTISSQQSSKQISHPTGLAPSTPEQIEAMAEMFPQVVDVRLNQTGLDRVLASSSSSRSALNYTVSDYGEEVITNRDIEKNESRNTQENTLSKGDILPSVVDNSLKGTFPEIGNQGCLSSCVAWSLAYYQLTNNLAVARKYNCKDASGENLEHLIMSPNFLYNMINGGANGNSYYIDALTILEEFGCANCEDVECSNNYTSIDFGEGAWEGALQNKVQATLISINALDLYSDNDLKAILNNGYVVTMGTNIANWTVMSGTLSPDNPSQEYVCTAAYRYISEAQNAYHALTIVGYNDNFWVDINGDDVRDAAEEGAFKVANSWGTSPIWYPSGTDKAYPNNNGYIWISYDAFKTSSSVPQIVHNPLRTNVCSSPYLYYIEPLQSYTPLLLAEVTVNTSHRAQLSMQLGVSKKTTSNTPKYRDLIPNFASLESVPFSGKQEATALNYDGSTGVNSDTTFVFDLTPLIIEAYNTSNGNYITRGVENCFYFKLTDKTNDNHSGVIKNFCVYDRIGNAYSYAADTPKQANGTIVTACCEFTILPYLTSKTDATFELHFNYPLQESTVNAESVTFYRMPGLSVFPNPESIDASYVHSTVDRKTIVVSPPKDINYLPLNYYRAEFYSTIKTDGGNSPNENLNFDFYIMPSI